MAVHASRGAKGLHFSAFLLSVRYASTLNKLSVLSYNDFGLYVIMAKVCNKK